MSVLGCTVPWAANYNPSATDDDGSCVYLEKVSGQCYQFEEVDEVTDRSFTVSMAVDQERLQPEGWVFYHDYFPDFYVHTRNRLINLHKGTAFYNNEGQHGIYHGNTIPKPFFIDVVFPSGSEMTLNSVNWITELRGAGNDPIDDDKAAIYNETITAITIWNQYQTTGRIALDSGKLSLQNGNNRNSEQTWSFNDFRDVLAQQGTQFLEDIFHDYKIDPTTISQNIPWFKQRLMEGNYFIVRFEFDNNGDKEITLHNVNIDASNSYR